MDIEQYLNKYDNYIRGLIYKRADSDYRDDAYQEVVMQIIQYKDKLDSLDTDRHKTQEIYGGIIMSLKKTPNYLNG